MEIDNGKRTNETIMYILNAIEESIAPLKVHTAYNGNCNSKKASEMKTKTPPPTINNGTKARNEGKKQHQLLLFVRKVYGINHFVAFMQPPSL